MQQLNSKNYSHFEVTIRDLDKQIILDTSKGQALMNYLATPESKGSHIKLNDIDGNVIQVISYDIKLVEPAIKGKDISEYV